ncbi:hypothetical protein ACIBI4_09130 [Streptomyces sp. NPDC050418]|uniref:hypothetical protein n=1 Tax=Streptomyces sp. NPDC050418 TaxID=3365612 RepID=UPI00379EEC97
MAVVVLLLFMVLIVYLGLMCLLCGWVAHKSGASAGWTIAAGAAGLPFALLVLAVVGVMAAGT